MYIDKNNQSNICTFVKSKQICKQRYIKYTLFLGVSLNYNNTRCKYPSEYTGEQCKKYGFECTEEWCVHSSPSLLENE